MSYETDIINFRDKSTSRAAKRRMLKDAYNGIFDLVDEIRHPYITHARRVFHAIAPFADDVNFWLIIAAVALGPITARPPENPGQAQLIPPSRTETQYNLVNSSYIDSDTSLLVPSQ